MIGCGWALLVTGAVWLLFSYNAVRPHYTRALIAVVSFFAGWLRAELALHALLFEALLLGVFVWNGALRTWPGAVGLVLYFTSMSLLILSLQKSYIARSVIETALAGFSDEPTAPTRLPWRLLLVPFLMRHPDVICIRNRVYQRTAMSRCGWTFIAAARAPTARRRGHSRHSCSSTVERGWWAAKRFKGCRCCSTSRRSAGSASASTIG